LILFFSQREKKVLCVLRNLQQAFCIYLVSAEIYRTYRMCSYVLDKLKERVLCLYNFLRNLQQQSGLCMFFGEIYISLLPFVLCGIIYNRSPYYTYFMEKWLAEDQLLTILWINLQKIFNVYLFSGDVSRTSSCMSIFWGNLLRLMLWMWASFSLYCIHFNSSNRKCLILI
jgi:predicted Na+-dependent transporter